MSQQSALITGANKGMGFETARQPGHGGMHVILATLPANGLSGSFFHGCDVQP